ncbi:MAG: Signal recognition particle receptor FtsY [Planctomycetes bacterium ADurb.Bin412]|nr:MAG: Signal recognition particle receptor FtsY [Planctomycetes bacterium ADurb.Bin412]
MAFFAKALEKFKSGLERSRKKINDSLKTILTLGRKIDEKLLEELEEQLISDDIGVEATMHIMDDLRNAWKQRKINSAEEVIPFLKQELVNYWPEQDRALKIADSPPTVILVTGVNGSGKTTSVAKLARLLSSQGKKVVLGACDTFRAAAVEQLTIWSERTGVQIVKHQQGSDPAAVAYDACEAALSRKADYLVIDTAGRLHTQQNLMRELTKIRDVVARKIPGAPHEVLQVLDATTGQNAINQAKIFSEAVQVTGILLAKLDGTAKGGIVIAIRNQIHLPVKFVGLGEKPEDLEPFDPETFVEALFS